MRRTLLALAVVATAAVAFIAGGVPAGAHTESDLVAVPAGSEATVTLRPGHGCAGSPTVKVRVRAEVAGATAGDLAGWTSSATADGAGRTVLEWSGGSLPADQTGAFPVHFTVPETPGQLLRFPAIQVCANGEDYAWIDGDPNGEYPAPRVLVLPAGSAPAASIDDVPADAPGRDQLTTIVDVDNPSATTVADAPDDAEVTGTTAAAPATTAPAVAADANAPDDDGGTNTWLIVVFVALLVGAIGLRVVAVVVRRRGGRGGDRSNQPASVTGGEGE